MTATGERAQTFGRLLLAAASEAVPALESAHSRTETFTEFDRLFSVLIQRSLRGERICRAVAGVGRQPAAAEILGLGPGEVEFIRARFGYEQQRSRGAWYLRPDDRLDLGLVNVGALLKTHPRFFWNAVLDERMRCSLASSAGALAIWSFLGEVFRRLGAPLYLRAAGLTELSREEQDGAWANVERDLTSLGREPVATLGALRYGSGWAGLSVADQLMAKQRYVALLSQDLSPSAVGRLRALIARPLVERYYEKAKARGTVLRRVVVTKSLEPVLSGVFGGDWLEFLAYVGEHADPKEQITTALEEPAVQVGTSGETGRPSTSESPGSVARTPSPVIAEKMQCLADYWQRFDELHAEQKSGSSELAGMIPGRFLTFDSPPDSDRPRDAFPAEFANRAVRLWGTVVVARWPETIVSEPYPAARMVEACGPILEVWHGFARACWAATEWGDESAVSALPHRLAEPLRQLADLDHPVDPSIFSDLVDAERRLGPPQQRVSSESRSPIGLGLSVVMTMVSGSRRSGFERLQDVVTKHRRAWAQRSLGPYLAARWMHEFASASEEFKRHKADRGKEPTVRQFVSRPVVSHALNNWLGGDINALYAAIRQRGGLQQRTRLLLPTDRHAFALRVADRFGGFPVVRYDQYGAPIDRDDYYRRRQVEDLVQESLRFVQLMEIHDRPPTLAEFSEERIGRAATVLGLESSALWTRYTAAVTQALSDLRPTAAAT